MHGVSNLAWSKVMEKREEEVKFQRKGNDFCPCTENQVWRNHNQYHMATARDPGKVQGWLI